MTGNFGATQPDLKTYSAPISSLKIEDYIWKLPLAQYPCL